jgi:hypothetical protein
MGARGAGKGVTSCTVFARAAGFELGWPTQSAPAFGSEFMGGRGCGEGKGADCGQSAKIWLNTRPQAQRASPADTARKALADAKITAPMAIYGVSCPK